MFPCQLCGKTCDTPVIYVKHMKIHSNVSNIVFRCCILNCNRKFKKHAGLKSHVYRYHKGYRAETTMCITLSLECHVGLCRAKSSSLSEFISHVKMHIKEGQKVTCPFKQCGKTFTVKSTFTSHLSRKHNENTGGLFDSITANPEASCSQIQDINILVKILRNQMLQHFVFKESRSVLLKLPPASAIQTITEDMQSIHEINQSHLLFRLQEKLISINVPEAMIKMVLDDLKAEDLFTSCNSHSLIVSIIFCIKLCLYRSSGF